MRIRTTLRRLCGLAAWHLSAAIAADSAPPLVSPLPETAITTTAPPAEVNAPSVEQVIVEAPEPRYAAPTRRDRIGRVWAPVMLNGMGPFRLVLDTGANGTAIIDSVATRLGISTANSRVVHLHGVTGSAMVPTIKVDTIEVGDLQLEGKRLPVVADVFGGAEGVLGTEGLLDKRIFIDFGNDEISIMRSHKQPAPIGFTEIPLTLGRDRLITFDVLMGSVPVRAVLDTGAQQTIGNLALREMLQRRRDADPRMQSIIGVTLDVAQGEVVPVPSLHIGSIKVTGLHLTFGDMAIFEHWKLTRRPALLIGMDIIGSFDVLIIDYRKKQLHIRVRT